jgi:gliding motility-associated-like protein
MMALLSLTAAKADPADPGDHTTWEVTASNYQYNMTVTTVLVFDMQESRDVNDKIAAFVGSECRGVAQPKTYVPEDDRYLAHLLVYSNVTSGEEVTLYMYDHSKGEIVKVAEKLDFASNATYGSVDDPYLSITTYDVNIRVLADNDTLEGANVWLDGYDDQTTNQDGLVTFSDVTPADSIHYSISAPGYETYTNSLAVVDDNVNRKVNLSLKSYNTVFEVIDNELPVKNARIHLEGYGIKKTDIRGKALFRDVILDDSIGYTISAEGYNMYYDSIAMISGDVAEKATLIPTTYNSIINVDDGSEPVPNAVGSVEIPGKERRISFNEATLPNYFHREGNAEWKVDSSDSFQGLYAIKSGKIYDNQFSEISFERSVVAGDVSFYTKVSAEKDRDHLIFYIDGKEMGRWSNTEWIHPTFKVEEGSHTFRWVYKKDASRSSGSDCAWIDYIQFPSDHMVIKHDTTSSGGNLLFPSLLPHYDSLTFNISHPEYQNMTGKIFIDDDNVIKNIHLNPVYSLQFMVESGTLSGNIPVSNAAVELTRLDSFATTNSFGETTFEGVTPHDSILYKVSAEGYYNSSGTVKVSNSDVRHQVMLEMKPVLDATNLITPNGDGKNDYWIIYNAERYKAFLVSIYTADGEKIYSTRNYSENRWDGKYHGDKLSDGVYYYVIKNPSGEIVFTGTINLVN